MAGDLEEASTGKVLRGELCDLPIIEGNVIRIFLSSTFTGRQDNFLGCFVFLV